MNCTEFELYINKGITKKHSETQLSPHSLYTKSKIQSKVTIHKNSTVVGNYDRKIIDHRKRPRKDTNIEVLTCRI